MRFAGRVPLRTVALEWARIGVTGVGGPPAHIALLRRLVVERRGWIDGRELEDAIAACNLLPGPASTQLAIFCARRLAGPAGALLGGLCFITPAVVAMIALSALFLAHLPPAWVRGATAGAGAAVAAVAVRAALNLLGPSWRAAAGETASPGRRARWLVYVALGAGAAAFFGAYLALVLVCLGAFELALRRTARGALHGHGAPALLGLAAAAGAGSGGLAALSWVALKVGALSFGGGFVIVPLMQSDAVHTYHWLTATQFTGAVALGQATPGPVLATVAAVGYAAHGVGGAALAAAIAFAPSFALVLFGARHFQRLRANAHAGYFLDGAGPAAIGAILGAAVPLAEALHTTWQLLVLAAAAVALLVARRGIVSTLIAAGVTGAVAALAGAPLPR